MADSAASFQNTLMVPELREMLALDARAQIQAFCSDLHPASVAEFLEPLEIAEQWQLLLYVDGDLRSDIFRYFEAEHQLAIAAAIDDCELTALLEEMAPDERTDLFQGLDEKRQELLYPSIARAERLDIKKLSAFEEGMVGAVMTTDYIAIDQENSVAKALETIRRLAPSRETVYYTYIVNDDRTLVGVVSLKDLILAPGFEILKNIMHGSVKHVMATADREEAGALVKQYDFLALPVVDDTHHLIGIVTVDDVVDILEEEATEDFYHLAAAGEQVNYHRDNIFTIAAERIKWLILLIIVGYISIWILDQNQEVFKQIIALTFFIPLLIGAGGNAGAQTTTIVIRSIATGELKEHDLWLVLRRELQVGLIIGLLLGALMAMGALLVESSDLQIAFKLGLTVGISVVVLVVVAKALGCLLPMIVGKVGIDPALISTPLIACIIDIVGILIYIAIAKAMFGL